MEETTGRNTKMLVKYLSIQLAAQGAYQQKKASLWEDYKIKQAWG